MDYSLLDSGLGQKLEKFGDIVLVRPCSQAIWRPRLDEEKWERCHAHFSRDGGNRWSDNRSVPESWVVSVHGIKFKLKRTDFGHLGIFPEHAHLWRWLKQQITPGDKVLNLFAYSGGATFAAAQAGAHVCHLDASKGMVSWARENAALNGLDTAPIRWITDDAIKFLQREVRRSGGYQGIILDPPSFGRGAAKEVFKIERDLPKILDLCVQFSPRYVALSCHTPGYTPIVLKQLLEERFPGAIEASELCLEGAFQIPCGGYALWKLPA